MEGEARQMSSQQEQGGVASLPAGTAPGGARPPLPAARHMALCCFPSAPPGLPPPSAIARPLRWGSGCPASSRPACSADLPGPAAGAGLAPSRLPCCSASRHGRLRCYMCFFFFFPPYFLPFFFFSRADFPAARFGWRRGGFGASQAFVLCGELHLVLHCRPRLGELGKPGLSNHFRGQDREEKQTLVERWPPW